MTAEQIVAVGTLVAAIAGACVTVYIALRKRKSEEKAEVSDQTREERESAIKEWQNYARQLNKANAEAVAAMEARYKEAIAKLEKKNQEQDGEILALIQRERECQVQNAENRAQIRYLQLEIHQLQRMIATQRPVISPDEPESRETGT